MLAASVKHPDYAAMETRWALIRDVLEGEERIKSLCVTSGGTTSTTYLPLPQTESDETRAAQRYFSYVQRAVLYNATERTLFGMVGQVFSKPPTTDIPESIKYLQKDPAGTGVTLEQSAKRTLAEVLSLGRCGLWVDAPALDRPISIAERDSGAFRPTITSYPTEDIINWRTTRKGALTVLSLVVLREDRIVSDDGFTVQKVDQWRELSLDSEGFYRVRVHYEGGKGEALTTSYVYPTMVDGQRFSEIPFVFIGIQDNDVSMDRPPLYALASLNLAHFRNSADYEESCFMVGQPTMWFSGVDTAWIKDVWKGQVFLGSRGGIPLPIQGQAGLLQANENGIVKEAMDQKESQMIALGARLVQSTGITRTATEASQDKVTEVSTLAAAARNTSAAYEAAFDFCAMFSGDTSETKFELSTDFDMSRMTSQEILALVATWQSKLLTTAEIRDILRRAGFATESIEDAIKNGVAKDADEVIAKTETDNRAKKQKDPSGVN